MIKYAVAKSGAEFRREMQRNSVAVRQLIHYKGQPDPLKGDSLNKAVRETAQETLSALFATGDTKPAPAETLGSRIQGFGNTNFDVSSEDKKSFLSEVVGIGSATLKQGLNTFSQSPSFKKNETGNYRGPNLQRSLTTESDDSDRYIGMSSQGESHNNSRLSQNANSGNWSQDVRNSQIDTSNAESGHSIGQKSREERLLETIVTSGGVRLHPTRDSLQIFLTEASKLDALVLSRALESKLQSPQWQVRIKAVCVLEAILRKKDVEQFSVISSYFGDNKDVVVRCSESPQASLREKASKVLSLLDGGEQINGGHVHQEKAVKAEAAAVQLPDLIDTSGSDDMFGTQEALQSQSTQTTVNSSTPPVLIDDLFGDSLGTNGHHIEPNNEEDPFADVSFLTKNDKEYEADLFSGMTVDSPGNTETHLTANEDETHLYDVFSSSAGVPPQDGSGKRDVNDLMASLSVNENDPFMNQNGKPSGVNSGNISSAFAMQSHQVSNDLLQNMSTSQTAGNPGMDANQMFPLGAMAYNMPPGFMMNPAFASQPLNYNAMGNLLAQQSLLATMSNFQQLGNLHLNVGVDNAAASTGGSALPDIFNPGVVTQTPASVMNNSKKEDTKAFDFISDHLASARDPRRVN
ncbi:hypothetical protein Leryth_001977 [Lithospermum erythrorhizon]|nr:hypothetical protein Leryth_001977 [Lithospermum erythrorhizon]